ncbi:MAG: hypothetical protein CMO16_03010 [Thaumarchaeota archaeon]|nr:hypothetical protein [Nitrososphaerota archaeon]|tara:strand:+ start:424 stop:651 length:228 start_codon:yes stop_codon:yes gene_type:complete
MVVVCCRGYRLGINIGNPWSWLQKPLFTFFLHLPNQHVGSITHGAYIDNEIAAKATLMIMAIPIITVITFFIDHK